MRIRFPLKELIRYSVALSVAVTIFLATMIYLQDLDLVSGISRAILSGAILFSTSMVSIFFIVRFEKWKLPNSVRFRNIRFVFGGLSNVLLMLLYHLLRAWAERYNLVPRDLYAAEEIQGLHGWQLFLLISISSFMFYALVHLLHNFILLNHLKTQTELELSYLRSANAETTNQLLRQQVQPHFLFNALNVLKSLIKQNPKTAEAYLLRLSDFLRMSFAQNKKDVATVREEIKLCRDYLEMQKMRFGEALEYTFDVPEECMNGTLPFFSLQPLAENALKHNQLTEENPLRIRISSHGGVIKVENNLQRMPSVESSTGNGLSNLSERYRLLSNDNIQIQDDGAVFSVALKII